MGNYDLAKILVAQGPQLAQGIGEAYKANQAKKQLQASEKQMKYLMDNRQDLVNPYDSVTNPFANLSVATQAAEMQAEETDIALANTLDTIRATGSAAGGATALAQAAARSKQQVSASIEQQEAKNEQLKAQGQQRMETMQAQGEIFKFTAQEGREDEQIYFEQRKADRAFYEQQAFRQAAGTNIMGAITGMQDDALSLLNSAADRGTNVPPPSKNE